MVERVAGWREFIAYVRGILTGLKVPRRFPGFSDDDDASVEYCAQQVFRIMSTENVHQDRLANRECEHWLMQLEVNLQRVEASPSYSRLVT